MKYESIGLQAECHRTATASTDSARSDSTEANLRDKQSSAGFSLLETLTALAILAISLVALFQAQSGGIQTTTAAVASTQARILAESVLAQTLSDVTVAETARRNGREGEFIWAVDISKAKAAWAKIEKNKDWQLYEVKVIVSWDRNRSITLQTLKLLKS